MAADTNDRAAQLLAVLVKEEDRRLLTTLYAGNRQSRQAVERALPHGTKALLIAYEAIDPDTYSLTDVGVLAAQVVLHSLDEGPAPDKIAEAVKLEAELRE